MTFGLAIVGLLLLTVLLTYDVCCGRARRNPVLFAIGMMGLVTFVLTAALNWPAS